MLGKEPIEHGRLLGDEISFTVGETTYQGRVEENRMQVRATVDGQLVEWTAVALPTLPR
jgi:hypothetical protein